jgi:hypothetical protein
VRYYLQHSNYAVVTNLQDTQNFVKLLLLRLILLHNKKTAVTNRKGMENLFF